MKIDTGTTAWMIAATALVLLMTPGLAFFYGGMTRAKSVLNMMMMSFVSIITVSMAWVLYGMPPPADPRHWFAPHDHPAWPYGSRKYTASCGGQRGNTRGAQADRPFPRGMTWADRRACAIPRDRLRVLHA